MDIATVLGLAVAVSAILGSVILEGGELGALINVPAAVLIVGGTIGATVISFSARDLRRVLPMVLVAMRGYRRDPRDVIRQLVEYADFARKEGLLALEGRLAEIDDPFLHSGLQAVVDGVDPELVRNIMETRLNFIQERHKLGASIFETAGGYAPTMGIIGTVMGLVHVLSDLKDVDSLGHKIATAFMATLYGIALANVLLLPFAAKLKALSKQEILVREIMLEGILSIQAGDNPRILEEKLMAFLPPAAAAKEPAVVGEREEVAV